MATVVDGDSRIPVVATTEVAEIIARDDAAKAAFLSPVYGAEWPQPRVFPNRVVRSGERLSFAGVTWVVEALGAGESHADSRWRIDLAGGPQLFVGDELMPGSHAFTADGHTGAWLQRLDALEGIAGAATLNPGHGPTGQKPLIAEQRRYLSAYREAVQSLRNGGTTLTDEAKAQLVERMRSRFPGLANEFLIAMGADAVAAELAAAAQGQ